MQEGTPYFNEYAVCLHSRCMQCMARQWGIWYIPIKKNISQGCISVEIRAGTFGMFKKRLCTCLSHHRCRVCERRLNSDTSLRGQAVRSSLVTVVLLAKVIAAEASWSDQGKSKGLHSTDTTSSSSMGGWRASRVPAKFRWRRGDSGREAS